MKRATELLSELIKTLQDYQHELDLFFSKGVYYFCGPIHCPDLSEGAVGSLTSIDATRDELGRFLIEFGRIKDSLCIDITRDVTKSLKRSIQSAY